MRNDIFNIQRYWKYQKHVAKTNWLPITIWGGINLLFFLLVSISPDWFRNKMVFIIPDMISTLGFAVTVALMCWQLGLKNTCISEMMIPASNLEKYLSRIVWFVIIPGIVYVASTAISNFYSIVIGDGITTESFILLATLVFGICLALISIFRNRSAIYGVGLFEIPLYIEKRWGGKIDLNGAECSAILIATIIVLLVTGYFLFKKMKLTLKDQVAQ